jgi:aerobic-type carbon monoxide dehydrogenase small subunit (CoxS/CutS family)
VQQLKLVVNGKPQSLTVDPQTPLLWVLRDTLGLTGTKFGCGIAQCGACTILVEGQALRSCVTPVGSVTGKVTTIEGLATGDRLHSAQRAWIDEQVPQCGYCQSGMLMTAANLLSRKAHPTDADIDAAFAGHICRCGTYQRIRRAIHRAASEAFRHAGGGPRS